MIMRCASAIHRTATVTTTGNVAVMLLLLLLLLLLMMMMMICLIGEIFLSGWITALCS